MRIFTAKNMLRLSALLLFFASSVISNAQCGAGETPLYLSITTDTWGWEGYWQITPGGNACGDGVIAEGGNPTQVGCDGANGQDASEGNGYDAFVTVEEGPFCANVGETYTLHFVDDWLDGGMNFTVNIFGFDMYTFTGNGNGNAFDFVIEQPLDFDVEGREVLSYSYVQQNDNVVRGEFFSYGGEVITDVEMSYAVNGGAPVTGLISGLNIQPFSSFELSHPVLWNEDADGDYEITVWVSEINGNNDMNTSNDAAAKGVIVGPGIPNVIDDFLVGVPTTEVIADIEDGVDHPRDLDFHPILTRNELWVILKSTENLGGKTVKLTNAGQNNQTALVQQDGNAWHFMSLPTGIAFSRNENFATSPGVYDANHDGGMPFTGPTLWDSDPLVYAQPSGGNGSHIDMLHESPYTMGIASEEENKFWVTCGDHDEIMSYDFREDHGPGNSDHSDGVIYKYPLPGYDEDAEHEVPDHLILDKNTGWLYICNSQQNRIVRLNTNSGTPGADADPHEATAVYKYMDNFEWEVYIDNGLNEPTGIDIIDNRLIVSNYNTGDINIYDISGDAPELLGIVPTGNAGIMGVKIGPDGMIWYVNSITNTIERLNTAPAGVANLNTAFDFDVIPNPASDMITVGYSQLFTYDDVEIQVRDMSGRLIIAERPGNNHSTRIDISAFNAGVYHVVFIGDGVVIGNERVVVK